MLLYVTSVYLKLKMESLFLKLTQFQTEKKRSSPSFYLELRPLAVKIKTK